MLFLIVPTDAATSRLTGPEAAAVALAFRSANHQTPPARPPATITTISTVIHGRRVNSRRILFMSTSESCGPGQPRRTFGRLPVRNPRAGLESDEQDAHLIQTEHGVPARTALLRSGSLGELCRNRSRAPRFRNASE